jgi:hypothetical protein
MKLSDLFQKQKWPGWTADAISLLGLVVYTILAMLFAHTTVLNLDEGGYLYKGLLYAQGVYRPFQPYGFWTNKAPLAFLIPGYVQLLFGEGLRTGRYLAVAQGILALVGLWVASRRMGGKWLAAGAVWIIVLSPAVIKVYSVGASQSLVACLVAWVLALSLGKNRPLWQLILSSVLASLMVLARQNMILILPLLFLYIFWEHGWKAGVWASLAGGAVFILGHVAYWPDILQIWVDWLPFRVPAWNVYRAPGGGTSPWDPSISPFGRLLSVFQGFRWHFVILAGSLFSIFLWPWRGKLKDHPSFRAIVFLTLLFLGLLYLHSLASLDRNYCVFCFAPYLSFFNIVGIVLVVILVQVWNNNPSRVGQFLIATFLLLIATGTGFATSEDTGRWLLNLPAPRVSDGQLLPGFTTVGETLFNKFALELNVLRRLAGAALGLGLGVLIILSAFLLNLKGRYNHGYFLANCSMVAGLLLSPFMAGAQGAPDCRMDLIAANEEIGAYLADIIPADSTVYWRGGLSVVPLLYVPQARIYAPQVNDGYSFKNGGDADALLKYGLWNEVLAERWQQEADIIIIEEWRYLDWKAMLTPDEFQEFPRTAVGTSCEESTRLRIFKRLNP